MRFPSVDLQFNSFFGNMSQNCLANLILFLFIAYASGYFCSSQCIDYVSACFDETPNGCWVCDQDIYSILPTATNCILNSQNSVAYSLLPNDPTMTLGDLTSTNPTPYSFNNYTISGLYSNTDTLEGNFTGLSTNHYAIKVRFGIGHLFLWNETDQFQMELTDSTQSHTQVFNYSCSGTTDDLTGTNHTNWECIRIRDYTMQHNDSFIHVKWSALYPQTNTSIQAWGIKQILVSEFLCHAYCATCTGALVTQCLSCATGYYLQGNTCVQSCEASSYALADLRRCVGICPSQYYASTNASTGGLECLGCTSGCALCSTSNNCQAWLGQDPNSKEEEGTFGGKLEFWLLLIIVVAALLVVLVYCLVKRHINKEEDLSEKMMSDDEKKRRQNSSDSDPNDTKSIPMVNLPNETQITSGNNSITNTLNVTEPNDGLWFNELVEMEPAEVQVRGRRRRRDRKEEALAQSSVLESKPEEEVGTSVQF